MKKRILLIRHAESLKNTLDAFSSLDGKEPLTKNGRYQASVIAKYIAETLFPLPRSNISIYCAQDVRSKSTAAAIAEALQTNFSVATELVAFSNNITSGKINNDIFSKDHLFEKKLKLYRSGLISANEVPWPMGDSHFFQRQVERFVLSADLFNSPNSIVVGHKSSLTYLALLILRYFNRYPDDFYGYIDIPPGKGILIEISEKNLDLELLDFGATTTKRTSNVVIKDGRIVFPGSACAVCYKEEKLLLVQQCRKGRYTWEIPGGKIEPSESPIIAAKRELLEETGYIGESGKLLYNIDLDLSISENKTYLVEFDAHLQNESSEHIVKWFTLDELEKMIQSFEITHVQTIIAFLSKRNRRQN